MKRGREEGKAGEHEFFPTLFPQPDKFGELALLLLSFSLALTGNYLIVNLLRTRRHYASPSAQTVQLYDLLFTSPSPLSSLARRHRHSPTSSPSLPSFSLLPLSLMFFPSPVILSQFSSVVVGGINYSVVLVAHAMIFDVVLSLPSFFSVVTSRRTPESFVANSLSREIRSFATFSENLASPRCF